MALLDKQRFTDGYWWSNDGLRLHYRDYGGQGGGRTDRPAILCLHGLTRNARDWEDVADRLAGEWRLIVPEMRGRGESGYARDPMSYVPLVYLQDVEALLNQLELPRVVAFGTSLGGILTGSPRRCSTMSGRSWTRRGWDGFAAMSGNRSAIPPGCTPRVRWPKGMATPIRPIRCRTGCTWRSGCTG